MDRLDEKRPSKRQKRDSSDDSSSQLRIRRTHSERDRHVESQRSRERRNQDKVRRQERGRGERHTRKEDHGWDRQKERDGTRRQDQDQDQESRKYRGRSTSPLPEDYERRYKGRRRHRGRTHSNDNRSDRSEDRNRNRNRKDRHRPRDRNRELDDRNSESPRAQPFQRFRGPLPSQNDAFSSNIQPDRALETPAEKEKPNFGLTGKLAAASNTIQTGNQTIVLKYHEPSEARKPPSKDQWRLYVFKDEEILDTVELSEQSCWLFGREVAVADFPIEHSSCSKQHAVIQFRHIEKRNEFGDRIGKVRPYVIDLESANGTTINEDPVPAAKYVELRDKDVLRFGHSSREYVIQLPSLKR